MRRPIPNLGNCAVCAKRMTGEHHNRRYCTTCRKAAQIIQGRAISKLNAAIRSGRLLHAKHHRCYDCDGPATCYDHRDYSKPLHVEPVCQSCNLKRGPAIWTLEQLKPALPFDFAALRKAMGGYTHAHSMVNSLSC